MTRLDGIDRLELYLDYLKNKKKYTPEEREALEEYFEDG